MAITQEQEDMRIAIRLKREGWIHDMTDLSITQCQERSNWCINSFGPMYQDLYSPSYFTGEGKWFGAELPFQTGGVPKRQFVFMFRDDKLYTMYRMMFP
jgi:hypothetical protein